MEKVKGYEMQRERGKDKRRGERGGSTQKAREREEG